MEFVEHPIFTRQRKDLIDTEGMASLIAHLTDRPDAGVLIPSGGGIRKLRVAAKGKGKSGGARVIYYWKSAASSITFLSVYSKSQKSDLTRKELGFFRRIIEDNES